MCRVGLFGGGVLYPEVGGRRTAGFYGIPSIQRKEYIAKLLVKFRQPE